MGKSRNIKWYDKDEFNNYGKRDRSRFAERRKQKKNKYKERESVFEEQYTITENE